MNDKSNGKVINMNDQNIPRIKAESLMTAGKIQVLMTELQLKFPAYFFELEFERQKLGPQNFYRVHLKCFNNAK